jgi:hypothetical protein
MTIAGLFASGTLPNPVAYCRHASFGRLRSHSAALDRQGRPKRHSLAERAINQYLEATPHKARKSGLRLIQEDVLVQHGAVIGVQHSFAETVNAYIEKKLAEV